MIPNGTTTAAASSGSAGGSNSNSSSSGHHHHHRCVNIDNMDDDIDNDDDDVVFVLDDSDSDDNDNTTTTNNNDDNNNNDDTTKRNDATWNAATNRRPSLSCSNDASQQDSSGIRHQPQQHHLDHHDNDNNNSSNHSSNISGGKQQQHNHNDAFCGGIDSSNNNNSSSYRRRRNITATKGISRQPQPPQLQSPCTTTTTTTTNGSPSAIVMAATTTTTTTTTTPLVSSSRPTSSLSFIGHCSRRHSQQQKLLPKLVSQTTTKQSSSSFQSSSPAPAASAASKNMISATTTTTTTTIATKGSIGDSSNKMIIDLTMDDTDSNDDSLDSPTIKTAKKKPSPIPIKQQQQQPTPLYPPSSAAVAAVHPSNSSKGTTTIINNNKRSNSTTTLVGINSVVVTTPTTVSTTTTTGDVVVVKSQPPPPPPTTRWIADTNEGTANGTTTTAATVTATAASPQPISQCTVAVGETTSTQCTVAVGETTTTTTPSSLSSLTAILTSKQQQLQRISPTVIVNHSSSRINSTNNHRHQHPTTRSLSSVALESPVTTTAAAAAAAAAIITTTTKRVSKTPPSQHQPTILNYFSDTKSKHYDVTIGSTTTTTNHSSIQTNSNENSTIIVIETPPSPSQRVREPLNSSSSLSLLSPRVVAFQQQQQQPRMNNIDPPLQLVPMESQKIISPSEHISYDNCTTETTDSNDESTHDDHDGDDAKEPLPQSPPISLPELLRQCWTCSVPLHCCNAINNLSNNSNDDNHNDDNEVTSLYAMHTHETLGHVPLCCICAEDVAAFEQERRQLQLLNKNDTNRAQYEQYVSSYCSGCAVSEEDSEGVFFLCDNKNQDQDGVSLSTTADDGMDGGCYRVFCFDCVVKSFGGGVHGMANAHNLVDGGDATDEPWICPCCQPPTELQALQLLTMEYYQLHEVDDQQKPRNDLSYLLEQLIRAEDEKERCEEFLSDSHIETKKVDFRQDIVQEIMDRSSTQLLDSNSPDPLIDYEDIDTLVQDAFDNWYEDWNNHEHRISDYISVLLDELDIDHQYTAAMCYKAIDKIAGSALDDDNIDATTNAVGVPQPEEDWVRAANNEIDQRMQQRKHQPIQRVLPDVAYEGEDFGDVEDLDVAASTSPSHRQGDERLDNATLISKRDGFASCDPRPSRQSILTAIENESAQQLNVQVKCHISDDQDQDNIYAESMQRKMTVGDRKTSQSTRNSRRGSRRQSHESTTDSVSSKSKRASVISNLDGKGNDDDNSTTSMPDRSSSHKNRDKVTQDGRSNPTESATNEKKREEASVPNDVVPRPGIASPIQLDHFYDCDDSPEDPTNTFVELVQQDECLPSNVTVDAMDTSFEATGSSCIEDINHHENVNVNVDHKLAIASQLPGTSVKSKTSNNGKGGIVIAASSPDIVPKALALSNGSDNIILIDTSCKKRHQSGALEGPFSIDGTSSKRKKAASKTIHTNRVHDPNDVTSQKQQQLQHPPTILCQKSDAPNKEGNAPIRTVRMEEKLWLPLKPHQIEGVRFMWRNSFSDFAYFDRGNPERCGGCILAHNMGLGKSLSTIALLHTVMTTTPSPLVRTVLLVVPVNTIANWENEFYIWQKNLPDSVVTTNLGHVGIEGRSTSIKRWVARGGVLLISDRMLSSSSIIKMNLQPDVLVLDEAHTMVRNSSTKIYKTLASILTPRKIGLTGSPFQNNLMEYFHLFNFVRPNVLGYTNEAKFDREFVKPITLGMSSNCSINAHYTSLEKGGELNAILDPFVHRVDSSELRKDLPPMQQVVIHVRQTAMQSKLYRAYKRYQRKQGQSVNANSFLKQFSSLRPIHNHPGSLFFVSNTDGTVSKKPPDDADDDWNIGSDTQDWWRSTLDKHSEEEVKSVSNGNKMILLLHLLTHAQLKGDKVVIFANSLATMDYLEYVLALDWKEHVPSLASVVDANVLLGRWQKNKEYVRIDGSISGAERGELVDQFEGDIDVKAFLISRAGGIGINLTKANRIVIVDQHFNPTVALQAIYRLYRYGQTKPVFCYNLLTQGTTEEKVYGRCVNKTGVAFRVIDKKTIERCFTAEELEDLLRNLIWVQCAKCEKWRVLVNEISEENVPDEWDCSMNKADKYNNTCAASDKSQAWYEKKYFSGGGDLTSSPMDSQPSSQQSQSETPNEKKPTSLIGGDLESQSKGTPNGTKKKKVDDVTAKLVNNDDVLKDLIDVTAIGKKQKLICDYYFHDTIMETKQSSDEIETVRRKLNP